MKLRGWMEIPEEGVKGVQSGAREQCTGQTEQEGDTQKHDVEVSAREGI